VSNYNTTTEQLAAVMDQYMQAAVTELAGKMPAHEALTLARASLHRTVDAAADRELDVHARFNDLLDGLSPREGSV
jgi:hypothetical protein